MGLPPNHAYIDKTALGKMVGLMGGLDGRADGLYRLGDVTGLDFKVQAVMLTQGDIACALLDAVEAIEAHGLRALANGRWRQAVALASPANLVSHEFQHPEGNLLG